MAGLDDLVADRDEPAVLALGEVAQQCESVLRIDAEPLHQDALRLTDPGTTFHSDPTFTDLTLRSH